MRKILSYLGWYAIGGLLPYMLLLYTFGTKHCISVAICVAIANISGFIEGQLAKWLEKKNEYPD